MGDAGTRVIRITMAGQFFSNLKRISKQRREERYQVNLNYLLNSVSPEEYRLLENTRSVILYIDDKESVTMYMTMHKWSYKGHMYFGTLFDCVNWIRKHRRRVKNPKMHKQV